LGLSILFLLYNLVNLPFTKAYHNYRANICHFCQFIVLFIAMYYRSMKSSTPSGEVSQIYSPVYLEYACILISMVVSLIVLAYEIYIWIKECSANKEKGGKVDPRQGSDVSEADNKLVNNTLKSIDS
jgi:large-conductance mechanosensitive channel